MGVGAGDRLLYIHPSPQNDLHLGRATGSVRSSSACCTARLGVAQALGYAWYRYHRIRFPDTWSYPGALLNSTATALIDEVTFRGALLGLMLVVGIDPRSRSSSRPCLHADDAPRGPEARPLPARPDARDRAHRRLADGPDRRDRRGVPGPRHHPLRGLPDDRPHRPDEAARPRGRGDRQAPPAARGLARHRRSRDRRRANGDARRSAGTRERRRPACTSTSRSASRSARIATSWCTRARPRAGRRTGSRRSSRRSTSNSTCAPTRSMRAFGDATARRSTRCTSAAARRRCCPPRRLRRPDRARPGAVRAGRRRGDHRRGEPRARRTWRRRRAGRRRRDPAVARGAVDGRRRADPARPPASRPRRGTRRSRPRARRASRRSAWTCSTTSRAGRSTPG